MYDSVSATCLNSFMAPCQYYECLGCVENFPGLNPIENAWSHMKNLVGETIPVSVEDMAEFFKIQYTMAGEDADCEA